MYNEEDIKKIIKEENVSYIKLQFSDVAGFLKTVEVPVSQIEAVLEGEVMFDGSSVQGFARINESDMFLKPDLDSFKILPWEEALDGSRVAIFMCDVLDIKHNPFEGDPRSILRKQIQRAKNLGFDQFNIGLEPEFFLFEQIDPNNPEVKLTDMNGYFDQSPNDRASVCRREIVLQLEKIGFEIEANHHEVAGSQHEINFKYDHALEYCDKVQIFKNAVKTIAIKHGMHATFMPKPIFGVNGSGMHSNLSLFKDGKNAFYDANGKSELSETAYHFIAGLIEHAREYTAVTNPLVNSYKRLVPGYEAPVYVSFSDSNRSAMIRIPATRKQGTRVEVRSVDAAANVYLAIASLLAAGLDGVERKLQAPEAVGENIFAMTAERKAELGIGTLPKSLREAAKEMEKSELMKDVLGEDTFIRYVQSKKDEYDSYRHAVHAWEIEHYLGRY